MAFDASWHRRIKMKIAETLARAGLPLGPTTLRWILTHTLVPAPQPVKDAESTNRVITSKYPDHVWIADLTANQCSPRFC